MKSMKKIRSGLIGLGLVIPVASVAGVVASCGKKETPPAKPTFDNFKDSAIHESLTSIIAHANPTATGWKDLSKDDLNIVDSGFIDNNPTITVGISSTSKHKTAVFSITFNGERYAVGDWRCSTQPTPTVEWDTFKSNAENNGAESIFKGIQAANPAGINIDLKSIEGTSLVVDKASGFSDNGKNHIYLSLVLKSANGTAFAVSKTLSLKINFQGIAYAPADWMAPDYTFGDFTKDVQLSAKTDSWKAYAAKVTLWNLNECSFGAVVANEDKTSLTIKINHTPKTNPDYKSMSATMSFHKDANNKVWIYGEQTATGVADGSWQFGAPAIDKWFEFKANVNTWAGDSNAISKTVIYFKHHPDTKVPFNLKWAGAISYNDNTWSAAPSKGPATSSDKVMYYTITLSKSPEFPEAQKISLDISITYITGSNPKLTNSNFKMIKFNSASIE